MLSPKAQSVIDLLKEVDAHQETRSTLQEEGAFKWLQCTNILNGYVAASDEYKALLERLARLLDEVMILPSGQHSLTFFELKRNGYRVWVTERDSFGPLGSAISCPDSDWSVCYG
jgi:hypothetical protein